MHRLGYLKNCFMLLVPIFLWNLAFINSLPETYSRDFFWKDIPAGISVPESILRILVFTLPFLMPLYFKESIQKTGLRWYLIGTALYFLSWIAQISWPESPWSRSLLGFTAPAFTPLIFMIGIGLIGQKSFIRISYISWIYIGLSVLFVAFHTSHAVVVFQRI